MAGPYKLKLKKLDFLSAVDSPAQGDGAKALLCKGKGAFSITAKVAKMSDELGLVFGYAFSSSMDGGMTPHVDYQDDAIDPDFLKAAMEFVEGGGATDVNHDGAQDGKIVFAWPLIPDVNKALGINADQVGLAVAIKPSPETYAKFKTGELTGFSIAGVGERTPMGKRRTKKARERAAAVSQRPARHLSKQVVLTSIEDGHQHGIDLDDPLCEWTDNLQTSYATSAGADNAHSHAWVFDPMSGAITVGMDSGHAHTTDAVVPADVIAEANAPDSDDAVPVPVTDEPSSGATVVVISASEPKPNSPPPVPLHTVDKKAKETTVEPKDAEIASLKKQLGDAMRLASLTDVQRAHHAKLSGEDAATFLAKSAVERDAEIAKADAANPVVFKGELTGVEVRKSDGELAKKLAEQNEKNAAANAGLLAELAKSAEARDAAEVHAIAKARIPNLPGDEPTLDYIVKSIRRGGGTADQIEAALKAVNGGSNALAELGKAKGLNVATDANGDAPLVKFKAELAEFAKSKNKTPEAATVEFIQTPRGAELYTEYEVNRLSQHRQA